jgi:hypothetical protein
MKRNRENISLISRICMLCKCDTLSYQRCDVHKVVDCRV